MNFNISTIQTNLLDVTGFEQSQNPQFAPLPSTLTQSTSGIILNDGTIPYLTLENIKDLGTNYNEFLFPEYNSSITYTTGNRIKYTYPTWLIGTTYAIGQKVVLSGVGYESLINSNTGNRPDLNLNKWKVTPEVYSIYDAKTNTVSTTSGTLTVGKTYRIDTILGTDDFGNVGFLSLGVNFVATNTTPTTWTNSTIVYNITDSTNLNRQPDINSAFFTEVILFNAFLESRLKASIINVVNKCIQNKNQILENKRLYYGIGDGSVTIDNVTDNIVGLRIDFIKNQNIKIRLNKIGLFFTGAVSNLDFYLYCQNRQIATFQCSTTDNNFLWIDLTNIEITSEYEGSWFLFYEQTGLTEKAVNNELLIAPNYSNFIKINPFQCDKTIDKKLIDANYYQLNTSFIANIDYSIVPDLTNWITYNKNLFGEAIKYQFALDIYKMFLTNSEIRSNRTERNIDLNLVKAEIYTSDNETIKKYLDTIIDNLRTSIGKAKIDNIGLPTKSNMINHITDL